MIIGCYVGRCPSIAQRKMLRDFNEYSILNGHAKVQLSHFGWKDCETSLPTWNKCKEVRGNRMGDTVFFLHPNKWRNGDALSPLLSLTFTKRIQWQTTPPLPAIGRRAEQRDRTHRMSLQLPYWWAHSPQHSRDHTFCGLMDDIGSAVFLEGVASVGYHSFREYWELKSVQIPNSVTSIRAKALGHCWKLKSMAIPDSVKPLRCSFANCKFTSIKIPRSVVSFEGNPFTQCDNLEVIDVSENPALLSLMELWWTKKWQRSSSAASQSRITRSPHSESHRCRCIYVCYSLTSITIPGSVKEIGDRPFKACFELRSIRIPESVKEIGTKRFPILEFGDNNTPWECWDL